VPEPASIPVDDELVAWLRKQYRDEESDARSAMQFTPDPDDPAVIILDVKGAAAAAHVSLDVIYQWALRGLIKAVTGPGGHFFREIDVLQAEASTRRARRAQDLLAEAAEGLDPQDT
jgi:hypothetical protein